MACLEPGASLSKIARACGVNANQLASWVRQHERSVAQSTPPSGEIVEAQASDFMPVRIEHSEPAAAEPVVNLQARLRPGPGVQRDRGLGESAVFRFNEELKGLPAPAGGGLPHEHQRPGAATVPATAKFSDYGASRRHSPTPPMQQMPSAEEFQALQQALAEAARRTGW